MTENIGLRKKICLLGDPAVGKTSLIRKYVHKQFSEDYKSTIGTEVSKREIEIDFEDNTRGHRKYEISLTIWDIIGQKEYRSLISRFYKNADGALMVCDLSREKTLENLREWASSLFGAIGKVPVVFVGNKYDLINEAAFSPDNILEMSCRYGAPWITTSAKNGDNVEVAFQELGELMIRNSLYFENMTSVIDVLDAIIVDFCEVHGGLEIGMPLFKEAFVEIPNANLKEPNKEVVEQLIKILKNITSASKSEDIATSQYSRFQSWLRKVE